MASDDYTSMVAALNNAKIASTTEETASQTSYFLGLVNHKIGNFDAAGQIFASISCPELAENCRYMMARCLIGQNSISEADKLLETLDASKAALSASDYLAMYNFYATSAETQKYEKAAEYAQKYIACEGADRKKGYEIGGAAYYNLAKAYQDGLDGREADARKILNYYEQAAKFENVEALYYLGEGYWSGRLLRNYSSANKYLRKAAEKGHKQSQDILREYGVNNILVKSKDPAQRTYYFRNGYTLVASAKTMKWMQLCTGTAYMENLISEEFVNEYRVSFNSFDQLVDGVHQLYSNQLAKMVKWGIDVLMAFGIDSYSASDILAECDDLSLLPRVGSFERKIQAIDRRAEQLHLNKSYAKATRARWTGSGFGTTISGTIKATIKANVAAGVMNVGSGILHGIGNSIAKAIDNAEIRKMGKEVFQDPYTLAEFKAAVSSACQEIASTLLTIVEDNTDYVDMEHLQGKIVFEGEKLASIDDRTLSAKIENNIRAHNDEYTYALLLEGLRRNPHDKNYFEPLTLLSFQMGVGEGSKEYDSLIRYPVTLLLIRVG